MPTNSIDCVITSPPTLWTDRGTGCEEPSSAHTIAALRRVFAELRRVLAADGTAWLHVADTYGNGTALGNTTRHGASLLGLPWQVALALNHDGWLIRHAIAWCSPGGTARAVRTGLRRHHDTIFLLAKQIRHYLSPAVTPGAITEGIGTGEPGIGPPRIGSGCRDETEPCRRQQPLTSGLAVRAAACRGNPRGGAGHEAPHPIQGFDQSDVWIVTRPAREPGFATLPIDIARRCIAAGCRPGGTVLDVFARAGSTGIAVRQLNRRYQAIEPHPAYLAIAKRRLSTPRRPQPK
jgi:hypothetical protein